MSPTTIYILLTCIIVIAIIVIVALLMKKSSNSCPSNNCPSNNCPANSCPSNNCPANSCPANSCPEVLTIEYLYSSFNSEGGKCIPTQTQCADEYPVSLPYTINENKDDDDEAIFFWFSDYIFPISMKIYYDPEPSLTDDNKLKDTVFLVPFFRQGNWGTGTGYTINQIKTDSDGNPVTDSDGNPVLDCDNTVKYCVTQNDDPSKTDPYITIKFKGPFYQFGSGTGMGIKPGSGTARAKLTITKIELTYASADQGKLTASPPS